MSSTLLHVVDEAGHPATEEICVAVQAAYTWVRRRYPRVDEAWLADTAEALGKDMCIRAEEIRCPRQYAFAVVVGRVRGWLQNHPLEQHYDSVIDLERSTSVQTASNRHTETEWGIYLQQIMTQFSDRDRQIVGLLQQGHDSPAYIATALGLKYNAAAKALQRAKDRLAELGFSRSRNSKTPSSYSTLRTLHSRFGWW